MNTEVTVALAFLYARRTVLQRMEGIDLARLFVAVVLGAHAGMLGEGL